jgi:hypothetical protein
MVATKFKNRHCDIYLPSEKDLVRWEELAKKAGISLSKFVYETVELHLDSEQARPRSDMTKELSQLREEIRKLREEVKLKSLMLEKKETEIFRLRNESFVQPNFQGPRQFNQDLVDILRQGGSWRGQDILAASNIDPRDSEAIRIVSKQLNMLRDFGLVEEGPRGWRWIK